MEIVLTILGIVALFVLIGFVGKRIDEKSCPSEEIKKKYSAIIQEIVSSQERKNKEYISTQQTIIDEKLASKKQFADELTKKYDEQIREKENEFNLKTASYEQQLIQVCEQASKEQALQVQGIIDFYTQRKKEIEDDFQLYSDDITSRRSDIEESLNREMQKQAEIIAARKREVEQQQDKDYYRIILSDDAAYDVQYLRKTAEEMRNPTTLYKLIYKDYYEKPFSDMVNRVVKGRGNIGIYKITNIKNGKTYIGQTRQAFKERWRTHLKRGVKAEAGTLNKLYDAMWKEGVENFTFEVLAECDIADLNRKEKEYIAFYQSNNWGYNSTAGNN